MIDVEHAKRVLEHQSKAESDLLRESIILEICERLIAIENRLLGLETRTRDRLDDFLKGATMLSIRFDRLEAKLNSKEQSC